MKIAFMPLSFVASHPAQSYAAPARREKRGKTCPTSALMPRRGRSGRGRAMGSNTETAWAALRDEAQRCTRCPLYQTAQQPLFGEGPVSASSMLVGEQPGDQEELAGRPFVGPAGRRLERPPP